MEYHCFRVRGSAGSFDATITAGSYANNTLTLKDGDTRATWDPPTVTYISADGSDLRFMSRPTVLTADPNVSTGFSLVDDPNAEPDTGTGNLTITIRNNTSAASVNYLIPGDYAL
jgi:hypothetical protein